jgi:hypothetical protein
MSPQDVREFVGRKPFQPFRMTLTDGRQYDVYHPELAMVGRTTVAIGVQELREAEMIYDRLVTVSLLHIMEIELLEGAKHNRNGDGEA